MPRRAKDMDVLAEKHRPPTAAEKAAARARKEQEAREAEARRLAEIEAAREARRPWPGRAEAPHPHNPLNRPPGWRRSRALARKEIRRKASA